MSGCLLSKGSKSLLPLEVLVPAVHKYRVVDDRHFSVMIKIDFGNVIGKPVVHKEGEVDDVDDTVSIQIPDKGCLVEFERRHEETPDFFVRVCCIGSTVSAGI